MTLLASHDAAGEPAFAIVLLMATLAAGAVAVSRLVLYRLAWTGQAFRGFA